MENLYSVEKDVDSVFSTQFGAKWTEVNKTAVTKCDKATLSNLVLSAVRVLGRSKDMLQSAAISVQRLTQEQNEDKKALLKLKDDLLKSKTDQVEEVQNTVKSEIRNFSDVVKQGSEARITTTMVNAAVRTAVKTAVMEDDKKKSVIVFNL